MIEQKCSRVSSIFLPNSFFQVSVNNTNNVRMSKYSEYDYTTKMSNFPTQISDFTRQYQKYARPETYQAIVVLVKLSYFNCQLDFTVINFWRIYKENRSLPNDVDLKSRYKIFNVGVDFI